MKKSLKIKVLRMELGTLEIAQQNLNVAIGNARTRLVNEIRLFPDGAKVMIKRPYKDKFQRDYGKILVVRSAHFLDREMQVINYYVDQGKNTKISISEKYLRPVKQ